MSIIILAAGKGKRMNNPSMAKVMALLDGKPLINYVLDTVKKINAEKLFLVIGYQKDSIIEFVSTLDIDNLYFVEQREQLGTGHAVAQVKPFLNGWSGDLLILAGDVPLISYETLTRFLEEHKNSKADLSVLTAKIANPFGYGRIIRNIDNSFNKIVEEKDADESQRKVNEINSGVYVVKSEFLFEALKELKNDNNQKEYYLTDIVEIFRQKNRKVEAFLIADYDEIFGINSQEDLLEAQKILNSKNQNKVY
ncbi:MAG: NTP transferase domain-containing protein [Candidatus Kapabacteria bacterium]|nr:NTP transferase domain-containing protein [Candidatus Kapabacteria bacterium]